MRKNSIACQDKWDSIERCIRDGVGVRDIIHMLHTSAATITRVRQSMVRREGTLYCGCGRPMEHRGNCAVRCAAQRGETDPASLAVERLRPIRREAVLPVAQSSFIAPITKAQLMAGR